MWIIYSYVHTRELCRHQIISEWMTWSAKVTRWTQPLPKMLAARWKNVLGFKHSFGEEAPSWSETVFLSLRRSLFEAHVQSRCFAKGMLQDFSCSDFTPNNGLVREVHTMFTFWNLVELHMLGSQMILLYWKGPCFQRLSVPKPRTFTGSHFMYTYLILVEACNVCVSWHCISLATNGLEAPRHSRWIFCVGEGSRGEGLWQSGTWVHHQQGQMLGPLVVMATGWRGNNHRNRWWMDVSAKGRNSEG